MPKPRRYDLGELWIWIWLQDNGVTARQIARHLGCNRVYVYTHILPDLENSGRLLTQDLGESSIAGGRRPAIYSPLENSKEK